MNKNLMWIGGGVVGLALIVWMAVAIAGEEPVDSTIGYGTPTVTGQNLPLVENPNAGDPAIGMTAPTVVGADWDGNEVRIEPDGRPKVIVFLAHWCPHCQAEVPVINRWLEEGGLPSGVDFYGATIFTDARRANFPPQTWLDDEGWDVPTVMDDAENSVALGYGVFGTPYYIVLDGQNRNLGRFSGEIGRAGLDALAGLALGQIGG